MARISVAAVVAVLPIPLRDIEWIPALGECPNRTSQKVLAVVLAAAQSHSASAVWNEFGVTVTVALAEVVAPAVAPVALLQEWVSYLRPEASEAHVLIDRAFEIVFVFESPPSL
jgi:hypothetical protein